MKMCATANAAISPNGTAKFASVMSASWLTSNIKNSSSITGAAAMRSQSSVVRLECMGLPVT